MVDNVEKRPATERVATGVPGLDALVHGGFVPRCVYLIQGRPGTGKTILANQVCFHHAARGGCAIYVTLLAEAHERMLGHLATLRFFDPSLISTNISYVSAFSALAQSGIKGLQELLSSEARSRRPTVIVVDGIATLDDMGTSTAEFKRLIHELQVLCGLSGATMLLLSSARSDWSGPVESMVDGVLELTEHRVAQRSEREIEISKFRQSSYLKGGHSYQITEQGLFVHPRLEALLQDPAAHDPCRVERISTGMRRFDEVTHGGLFAGSSTVVFGPTGAGKTTLGLHFLSRSSAEEPGLHFGFFETPARVLMKGRLLGLELEELHREGHLELLWFPPTERMLDALGHRLLTAVRERGVKRLFVDGIDGLTKTAREPDRIAAFMSALTNQLRVLGVTTLYTSELNDLFTHGVRLPIQGISAVVENIVLMRLLEAERGLARTVTVLKLRDSGYDESPREFRIAPHETDVAEPVHHTFGPLDLKLGGQVLRRSMGQWLGRRRRRS